MKTLLRLIALILATGASAELAAAEHIGQVTFGGLPVPGATVRASQGEKQFVTITDPQGAYRFGDLADGAWTVRVEMLGFATITQDVAVAAGSAPSLWELTLVPFAEIARAVGTTGFQHAAANVANGGTSATAADLATAASPVNQGNAGIPENPVNPADAADGLLVNGSVNNGAASPFAQLAAFGNNRRGGRALFNGGLGVILGNSAFDARPFSFNTNQNAATPSYHDAQFAGTFGGPVKIPGLVRDGFGPNLFALYQRTSDHTATTQPALMPTPLERIGDFSETRDALGRLVQIRDPLTGRPFPGSVIPADRITPQAAALLGYYPFPGLDVPGGYNYQRPVLTSTRQDSVQTRIAQPGFGRTQLFGTFAYQRTRSDITNVFGFNDATKSTGIDGAVNWSRRFSPFFTLRLRYQYNRLTTEVTPYFANRTNVSGDAQIGGNNQEPVNWGPPKLSFSSGVEPLVDGQYAFNRSETHAWNGETLWGRGRHNITIGGDVRWQHIDIRAQQDPRGAFTFTGAATGVDLADFLLGTPHASSIAFGNADKFLRAPSYHAYITDDWRFGPGLTMNSGVRWEYEAPITERSGRLVNLDIASGFTAVSPVLATDPVGALTGRRYPESLVAPDKRGIQPRIGFAWRPVAGSSLVIRAGYGLYRNTSVYQSIAMLMAQQSPLSKSLSVESSAANPLTLADGFTAPAGATTTTFAVDPDFRVGYAENWQASVQRDLPASLTVLATYLGTRGHHLMQQLVPNTYPSGAVNPCSICPAGFVYLTSNGRSTRHAGQLQLRRRLRDGLTATVQYTLSKAMDDAAAFSTGTGLLQTGSGGASLAGAAISQDWLNLEDEWAPSNFDQRHLVSAQFQYTTGVGVRGGALMSGVAGTLFKGWTFTSQLTAGSGLPLTPIVLSSLTGTGVTGTIRPDLSGASTRAPAGYYANPAAYTAPAAGRWGNAGRNSVTGPAQFGLNAGVTRTFLWGDRLNLDWRVDATNVLNRVTYAGVNAIVGSPQFGLPNLANAMRKLQTSIRLRF